MSVTNIVSYILIGAVAILIGVPLGILALDWIVMRLPGWWWPRP
jgi:hypothetical protein